MCCRSCGRFMAVNHPVRAVDVNEQSSNYNFIFFWEQVMCNHSIVPKPRLSLKTKLGGWGGSMLESSYPVCSSVSSKRFVFNHWTFFFFCKRTRTVFLVPRHEFQHWTETNSLDTHVQCWGHSAGIVWTAETLVVVNVIHNRHRIMVRRHEPGCRAVTL